MENGKKKEETVKKETKTRKRMKRRGREICEKNEKTRGKGKSV